MVFPFLGFICSRRFQSCSKSGPGAWEVALPAFRCQKGSESELVCLLGWGCLAASSDAVWVPCAAPGGVSQLWGGDVTATVQIGKPASYLK